MDEAAVEKVMRKFWRLYAEDDLDGCEDLYLEHLDSEDPDDLRFIAQMSIAMEEPEANSLLTDLLGSVTDGKDPELNRTAIMTVASVINDTLDRLADLGRFVILPDFFEIDVEADIPGTLFPSDGMEADSIRLHVFRHIVEKLRSSRKAYKINSYLSFLIFTMQGFVDYDNLTTIFSSMNTFILESESATKKKDMRGNEAYALLLSDTVKRIGSALYDEMAKPKDTDLLYDLDEDTEVGDWMMLYAELSQHPLEPVSDERLEMLFAEFVRNIKGKINPVPYSD